MKNSMKKVLSVCLSAVLAASMTVTAFADEPYESYIYDTWEDAIPSQSAYRVDKTVTGFEMGLTRLTDKNDELFVSEDAPTSLKNGQDMFYDTDAKEFWICDTDNARIIRLDENMKLIGCYTGVKGKTKIAVGEDGESKFNTPTSIYVKKSIFSDDTYIYIADSENNRVLKATAKSGRELDLVMEYTKPDSKLYTSSSFVPSKVLADKAENVYAVCKSVNTGSVEFSKEGEFQGYYGANRVEVTAAVIAQKLWRKIASKEQVSSMVRNVPVEYANFDIDEDGFIYTVTEAANAKTDAVKKLNPAGYNIWDNDVGDKYKFGDIELKVATQTSVTETRLTDIVVSDNGVINVLDYSSGRVFQYDRECNLLSIFGTKNSDSDEKGSFISPNAVEANGNKVYVLDGSKNDITVFTETSFGSEMHYAAELYDQGRYSEAQPTWEKVLNRDGGYPLAYIGLGKAALNEGEYTKALHYFKTAYDQDDYDKAFKYAREDFIRDHFTLMLVIILVIVALLITKAQLKKKGIKIFRKKHKEGK